MEKATVILSALSKNSCIEYAVAIRSNHEVGVWEVASQTPLPTVGVWLPSDQKVRVNKWRDFEHIRWDGKPETRSIREIIYGRKRAIQYWEITTDKENQSPGNTWFVMTRIPDLKYHEVGAIYGIRTWIEYGFKQCKSELGWADFRVTPYAQIQKWWELIMSAYLMVCLHNDSLNRALNPVPDSFQKHEQWNQRKGWKNWLNNLQLILQPFISFNLLLKWLKVFPIPLRLEATSRQ